MASKMTEKERKRIEIQKRKFQLEQERMTRPGECNKYLFAIIQNEITQKTVGSKIVEKLREIDVNYEEVFGTTPGTVTWKRTVAKRVIDDEGEVIDFGDVLKDEPFLLIILEAENFVKQIKENRLLSVVQAAQEVLTYELMSTTLVVFGLKDLCRRRKNIVGIRETEIQLTQLQLLANCSHRLHETPDDIALTVAQMSKAIAEEPYKKKQNQKLDQEQLYLTNDTKTNVNADDPNSFARLWHTQLITLPKVTYEVAQSITRVYPLPRLLIEAYKTSSNPVKLLADIPIVRTGPLAKTRKIGPELSRKIYTLLTSRNPEDIL